MSVKIAFCNRVSWKQKIQLGIYWLSETSDISGAVHKAYEKSGVTYTFNITISLKIQPTPWFPYEMLRF